MRGTSAEIAKQLALSLRTAENHRTSLMRKLGLRTIADLDRSETDSLLCCCGEAAAAQQKTIKHVCTMPHDVTCALRKLLALFAMVNTCRYAVTTRCLCDTLEHATKSSHLSTAAPAHHMCCRGGRP
jgi:sensor c-di-GMP phosphodiesterase-like protein